MDEIYLESDKRFIKTSELVALQSRLAEAEALIEELAASIRYERDTAIVGGSTCRDCIAGSALRSLEKIQAFNANKK